ncbi:hypothetical protein ASPFODRAFT_76284 [Aspergillus luchuensis CBS 106.47]|uniref:Uncharacterized protein n=1 Tax=Aspergillus luchuensis (strain CBS 106.47) TaxID=1137211 RepID=A0A1M3TY92_ASPLC|nr:hypothetical protein ASPFODRAFT_76284 [Aspergillus luchuensis CBS 106.47]
MSLRNLFGTLRRSREKRQDNDETFKEARKEILNNLREVHRSVKLLPLTSLTNDQAAEYNIRCHDLRLRTDGGSSATAQTYFKPWTLDKLEQFPLDLDDPDTKKSIRTNEACFAKLDEERSRESTGELDPERDDSGLSCPMRNTGDGATLDDLSGWFGRYFNNTIIKERYMNMAMFTDPGSDPLASPPLRFEDAWYPNLPEGQELPHINLIVTLEGVCDDNILRSELLVLLGVMRTRLLRVVLKDHIVAPVLLASCANDLKARVLIAYFDCKKLVVLKSPLHDFYTPEARERDIPLFLLYMCSQAVGDTKALPAPMDTEEHATE